MPSSPPERTDVVIIGGGMGGLTAAALLSKAGLSVCVFEMDARPGGYLAGYRRKGFVFDTAIHWLNQCGPGGMVRRIFDFIGPGAAETKPLRSIRRYRGDSFDYLLTANPDDLRDQLSKDHPEQALGLRKFFRASRTLGDAFAELTRGIRSVETMSTFQKARHGMGLAKPGLAFAKYAGAHTEPGVDKHFKAPILKKVFCSEERLLSCLVPVGWAYRGDYQMPPDGGSQAFPRFLVRASQAFAARVFYKARVDKIVLDGGEVAGVEVQIGIRTPKRYKVACDYVLAACDLETVYQDMLPDGAISASLLEKLRAADIADSTVTLSIGLNVPPEALGFGEELTLLSRDDVSRTDHNCGDPHRAAISILAPSLRDPSLAPEGEGTLTFFTSAKIGYGDRWRTGRDDARGPEYVAFKTAYADVLIDRVAAAFCPNLRDHIKLAEVATPVTHLRYTGNKDGTIMGARATRENMRSKVAHYITPIRNLFVSGHWAEYGGGVPVAVRAGVNSALLVLQRTRPAAFELLCQVVDQTRATDDVDPELFASLPT